MKEIIGSSDKRPVLSREEAVKRARQKRFGADPQKPLQQEPSGGRRGASEPEPRRKKPLQQESSGGRRRGSDKYRQKSGQQGAPGGEERKPSAGSRSSEKRFSERESSGRRALESRSSEKRFSERESSGRRALESRSSEKRFSERESSGRRVSKSRSSGRKRRRLFPAAFALLLVLLALFVIVKIIPGLIREVGNTVIRDTVPPVIELTSDPDYIVYPGQEYEEEGYTATDDRDGDLTDKVSRTVEDGQICYRVTDQAGNSAVRYREIPYAEVSSNKLEGSSSAKELAKMRESFPRAGGGSSGSGKTIYLTFDDGPGQYTERLLKTLERNNVHVTFFVTGAFPVYEDMIKKEYEAGHSIGIHTFSHDFDSIYKDADAFWKDIGKMQEVVVRQTGHPTNLMRFAGGSSNTVGVWQTPGIMELLVKQAPGKGFQYFDWNVSSGDGAAEGDSAMVISRITSQIQNYDQSVVLCHDTKEYTVNAMEYLIPWLLDNGYTISPLSFDSEPAHHLEAEQ